MKSKTYLFSQQWSKKRPSCGGFSIAHDYYRQLFMKWLLSICYRTESLTARQTVSYSYYTDGRAGPSKLWGPPSSHLMGARGRIITSGASFIGAIAVKEAKPVIHLYLVQRMSVAVPSSTYIFIPYCLICRSQWPRGLRHRSTPAHLVRLWVRIPQWWIGCLSVVSVVCCQVEVSATSWSLIQRSPTDCGASLCVI
jgi:hypothetical protein